MVAKVLIVVTAIFILFLFLPWQQNIRGKGKLTALNPKNRPQLIQSAIAGRITQWHIVEGDYVNKGDTLLSITEIKDKYFDPNLVIRLEEQLEAKKNSQEAKTNKTIALRNQIAALKKALIALTGTRPGSVWCVHGGRCGALQSHSAVLLSRIFPGLLLFHTILV